MSIKVSIALIAAIGIVVLAFRIFSSSKPALSEEPPIADHPASASANYEIPAEVVSGSVVPADVPEEYLEKRLIPEGCEIDYDADGNEREMLRCEPLQHTFHEYWSYPPASLKDMAYGDAKASEVLGMMLMSVEIPEAREVGLEYLLRAAAISGKSDAIDGTVGTFFSMVSDQNGPRIDNMRHGYILTQVANRLAGRDGNMYQRLLREHHVTDEEIRSLDAAADQTLQNLATLQYDITGERSIGELIGAAD